MLFRSYDAFFLSPFTLIKPLRMLLCIRPSGTSERNFLSTRSSRLFSLSSVAVKCLKVIIDAWILHIFRKLTSTNCKGTIRKVISSYLQSPGCIFPILKIISSKMIQLSTNFLYIFFSIPAKQNQLFCIRSFFLCVTNIVK